MKTKTLKLTIVALSAISALSLTMNVSTITAIKDLRDNMASKADVAANTDKLIAIENGPVKDFNTFIMDNPELIVKSLAKYRFEQEQKLKQAEAQSTLELTDAIYNDFADPILGNPEGKHVLVKFIDYNCGYCKRFSGVVEELIRNDPEAKVIVKEFPIFHNNPSSEYSAVMATAMYHFDSKLYAKLHHLFANENKLSVARVDELIKQLGVQPEHLKPYITNAQKQVAKNRKLGAQLKVTGTPTAFDGKGNRISATTSAVELQSFITQ